MKMKTPLMLMLVVVVSTTFAQKNFIDQHYVAVSGSAEMLIVPDLIYIGIRISEKDPKNKAAIDQSEQTIKQVLQSLGIDVAKELTVSDLSSSFKQSFLAKADIILGREYEVVVHDGKTASKVFVELQARGISNVNINRIDHTKIQEYKRQVKIDAIKAAREKASALAQAIGQNIGKAMLISESDGRIHSSSTANYSGAVHRAYSSDADAYKDVEIDFEKIKISSIIDVSFELL